MSAVLATPLLPATLAAIFVAIASRAGALPAYGAAALLGLALAALAAGSVTRRRIVWAAAAVAAVSVAARIAAPVPLALPAVVAFDVPRAALARAMGLLVPSPESALLAGIVLGERGAIPAELSRAFAVTGTTHLLAISGFNMTLVAAGVALVLSGRAGPITRAVVSIAAIVAYSLLVGPQPSVLRAALMSGVAACGIVSGRRAATANALCAAVLLMLLADPAAVADLGLQLSALATAGLVLWQAPIAERLSMLPAWLRHGIATTAAATAPTLPVIAAAFGRVSLVSLLANLVCVPLFPLLMLAGAATSALGTVALDLARPVALVAWVGASALRTAVQAFASLPLASLAVPDGTLTGIVVASLETAAVAIVRSGRVRLSMPRPRWRRPVLPRMPRVAPGVLMAIALVPGAVAIAWPANAPTVRVIALDVGQGDAYLVEVGGARMLVDGGPDPARLLDELGATLAPWDRRLDVVALTHAHTDHGAGLLAALDRFEVGVAIEPEGLNPGPLADLWSAAVAKSGAQRRALHAGQRLQLGAATVSVLAPDPDLRVDVPSLVLLVERGDFSVLFTGDAVDDALARLLARQGGLRARVYVPPHHGAATEHGVAMRAAVRPDAALISVGAGNRYGHPTAATLAALAGVPTYRTDQDGTVEIALDGSNLVVRTHANGLPPPRRGSVPYPAARQ